MFNFKGRAKSKATVAKKKTPSLGSGMAQGAKDKLSGRDKQIADQLKKATGG